MESAEQLLEAAERIDGYRAACEANRANRAARYTQDYSPSIFSEEDTTRLMKAATQVPLLDGKDIVVLDASADGGFPHTRPNGIVCIPTSLLSEDQDALEETLAHEAIHLHQRENPGQWLAACKADGWTEVQESVVPPRYWERRRINPDTMLAPLFAWETSWIPLPLFNQSAPTRLSDVSVKWLDIRSTALLQEPPSSFSQRYGTAPQPEHPYELLAVEAAADGVRTKDALSTWLAESMTIE